MAQIFADRVQETTTTTGAGTLTLAGAVAQFQTFSTGIKDGNTVDYCLLSGNGVDWETGIGTYTALGNTLSRDVVYASSNLGLHVSLSGASTVFGTITAHKINPLILNGATSGTLTVKPAAIAGSNTLTLPAGTTDFSATGGAHQYVAQLSLGGPFTVVQPATGDLSDIGAFSLATSGTLKTTNATASTSSTTGALTVSGGFGVGGAINSGGSVNIPTGSAFQINADVFLTRAGVAAWQLGGVDAAVPSAQTLGAQNVVAGTTNTAGASLTISGSKGTGSGVGGSIIFQTAPAGAAGSAQNPEVTALTISGTGTGTFANNLTVNGGVQVSLPFGTEGTVATFRSGASVDNSQGGQIQLTNSSTGNPAPNKYIRIDSAGYFAILNSGYTAVILTITDSGIVTPGSAFSGPTNGVVTNSNAAAGNVGEYISAVVVPASAVALVSGTAANVTSISLTAGDWDVSGSVGFSEDITTTSTEQNAAINTTSAALPALPGDGIALARITASATGDGNIIPTGTARLSLAVTTTVYLVARATFATSTCAAYGIIRARRMR